MRLLAPDVERELIDRIRRGDDSAMRSLYERLSPWLGGICARYLSGDESVRDVLQEVFVKIFTRFDRFTYRGAGSLQAWAGRIAVNESLMFLKERHREKTVSLDLDLGEAEEDEGPEVEDIPEDVVLEMVRQLPDRYRTVFNLYVFEDLSHKEIASLLHIKEDTSASDLHRARKLLCRMIDRYRTRGPM